MSDGPDERTGEARAHGLEILKQVYGESAAGGDFFAMTVEHLFSQVWSRDRLSLRDRRLLLLGLLVGQDLDEAVELQLDASLRTGELTPEELREVVIFLTLYAGWVRGAKLDARVERLIERFMNPG